ncbi:hypothetical protein RQP46_008073 [Phenoliferia psychrophenolica]
MAKFTDLAPELLSHLLDLSTDGEPAKEEQRARFQFGLIARPFYLATTNATSFHVEEEKQAKAFVAKLEREELEKPKSPPTTSTSTSARLDTTPVTNIRKLSIIVQRRSMVKFVEEILLRAAPTLVTLELDVSRNGDLLERLEVAMARLAGLRELHISAFSFESTFLTRAEERDPSFPDNLFKFACTNSTTGLRVVDFGSVSFTSLVNAPNSFERVLPHVTNITSFTWEPHPFGFGFQIEIRNRDEVLDFLGAMNGLESIAISMWEPYDSNQAYPLGIDHKLLDTLATLPLLHTVKLFVARGEPGDQLLLPTFMRSCPSLRTLSITVLDGWSRLQRDHVEEAAEEAGVAFTYREHRP